jgi:hypothetical protein
MKCAGEGLQPQESHLPPQPDPSPRRGMVILFIRVNIIAQSPIYCEHRETRD